MVDDTCGIEKSCVWRAARTLGTKPHRLCSAFTLEGDPCGVQARLIVADSDSDAPTVSLCQKHYNSLYDAFEKLVTARMVRFPAEKPQPRPKPKQPGEGHVYFAQRADLIKIGYSSQITKRLRDLELSAGRPFDEVITERGSRALEARYHRKFSAHRVSGEWFQDCPEIREVMATIRTHGRR